MHKKGKLQLLIPKLIYPCTILDVPTNVVTEVEKLLSDFFWNCEKTKNKKRLFGERNNYRWIKTALF